MFEKAASIKAGKEFVLFHLIEGESWGLGRSNWKNEKAFPCLVFRLFGWVLSVLEEYSILGRKSNMEF